MKESLKLFLSFIALCFGLNFIYFGLLSKLFDLRIIVANLVAKTLHTFLLWNTSVDGLTILVTGKGAITVINECTGIFSLSAYIAIVLAYDTTLKNKAWGLVVGIPVLFSLAVIRLSLTTLTAVKYPEMLHMIHDYLFQIFLLVFVVVLFVLWHNILIEKKHNLKKYTVLFGEFIILTTILFLAWTQIATYYAYLVFMTTTLFFNNITINYNKTQLFMVGMLSPIPSFIALIAITPQIKWKKKLGFIGIGSGLIFVFGILLEIIYIFTEFNKNSIFIDFTTGFLFGTSKIILPLCIWVILVYYLPKNR